MRYYLDLFTPETWAAFRKSGESISGFREKQRKTAERIEPGDIFLCYVVRVSRWCGVLEISSRSFTDTTPIFLEPDPFVIRFRVKPQITLDLEHSIPMLDEHVWSKVSFTQGIRRGAMGWAQFLNLRASLREINAADGKILREMLLSKLRNKNHILFLRQTNGVSD
jgi:predicted RNA-binding protein